MRLSDYLQIKGLTATAFAGKVHLSLSTISRYCTGRTHPRADHVEAIKRATRGQVTADDFYHRS